ncbi:MAG: hypothetical protein RR656_04910, partial [Cetobacterium sp.]
DRFQKLDNKYQVILMKAAKDVAIEERSKIIYEEKRIINRFEREGMTITKITKKDREKIRKMTTPVYKIYEDTYGSELLNSIYKEVNKK